MEWHELQQSRLAVFSELVSRISSKSIGRTMLMKLCYFLQEVKGVPLGYRFTIYSYGPFDSDVLSDLSTAVSLGAIKSTVVYNSVGYGYELEPGDYAEVIKQAGEIFLSEHRTDIDWVIKEFSQKSASDLELESTAVFVDRETKALGEQIAISDLADKVHRLKPHFKKDYIEDRAKALNESGLLSSILRPTK